MTGEAGSWCVWAMKTISIGLVLAFVLAGCGKKTDGGAEVLAKLEGFEKSVCACADEACAKKLHDEHEAYLKGGAIKKPTDKQMETVMDIEHKIEACEKKFILSELGAKMLDEMKTELVEAKKKVAEGKYSEASFGCGMSIDHFKKEYGAIAESKPDIKTFLDEFTGYCKEGMHIEAVTAAATKAETARTATPTGSIPECSAVDVTLAEVKMKDVPGGPEKIAPLKARFDAACHK